MTHQINFTVTFRNQPSLTLNAQLYDAAGATVGSAITTGFINLGYGVYSYLATLPDGHVGSIVFWDTGDLYRRFGLSVNPQETENADAKASAIKAKTDNLPALPASTTNITGGTITTVTNLTNAPTAGDLTATMKTSVTAAATAATPTAAAVTGAVGSVTAGVTVTTNSDKTGYGLSSAAIQAIWDALTSALTTAGSIGKRLADNIDTAISSRMATFSYTTPPTAVQNRQEMDSNSTKLANLDATVASRLATSGYTVPPTVAAIRSEIDSNSTKLDATVSSRASQTSLNTLNDLGTADIDARLTAYDGATQTDLNAAQTTITTAIAALNNLSAAQVWSYGTRTLTSFGTLVADIWSNVTRTLTSGGGGATVAEIWDALVSSFTTAGSIGKLLSDNIDAAISSRVTISSDTIMDETTTGVWNFVIEQGATFRRTLTVTKSVGLFDAEPYSAAMMLRRAIGDETPVLSLTSDDALTLEVADGGTSLAIALLLSATVTAALNAGHAVYDLELTDSNGDVVRLLSGKAVITREVTRE